MIGHTSHHAKLQSLSELRTELDSLIRLADPHRCELLLDVGTGGGTTAAAFAGLVKKVVAIDISESALADARKLFDTLRLSNVETIALDATDIALPDNTFDIVTFRYAAHHVTDMRTALSEIYRVLSRHGRLVVEDKMAPSRRVHDVFTNQLGALRDSTYVRAYTEREWKQLVRQTGFSSLYVETFREEKDVEAWLAGSMLQSGQKKRIREHLLNASPSTREYFAMRFDGGRVIALTEDRIRLKAAKIG